MPRKSKKILSRLTSAAIKRNIPISPPLQMTLFPEEVKKVMPISMLPDKETPTDRVFRLIYENSIHGYCFTEPSSGIPWIQHQDIEDRGDGLFVIRFRCPPSHIHGVYFWDMANRVLDAMKSKPRLFHETKTENGISYEDCIWVIQEGDNEKEYTKIGQEEAEVEISDSMDEFDEALSNFV